MKVKIRSWKSMKKEFGFSNVIPGKAIATRVMFQPTMRKFCGKKIRLTDSEAQSFLNRGTCFPISSGDFDEYCLDWGMITKKSREKLRRKYGRDN